MDLEKMNYRKELVPLAKRLGIFRPNSKTRDRLIELIRTKQADPAPADDKGRGLTGALSGGEKRGSPPPQYQARIVIHEQADIIMLNRLADNCTLALLCLDGALGTGRKPKIQRMKEIAAKNDLTLDPAILIQV